MCLGVCSGVWQGTRNGFGLCQLFEFAPQPSCKACNAACIGVSAQQNHGAQDWSARLQCNALCRRTSGQALPSNVELSLGGLPICGSVVLLLLCTGREHSASKSTSPALVLVLWTMALHCVPGHKIAKGSIVPGLAATTPKHMDAFAVQDAVCALCTSAIQQVSRNKHSRFVLTICWG